MIFWIKLKSSVFEESKKLFKLIYPDDEKVFSIFGSQYLLINLFILSFPSSKQGIHLCTNSSKTKLSLLK
jgi:hypothetical protein